LNSPLAQTHSKAVYNQRRRVLFNLYAFDEGDASITSPPELYIQSCDFEYLLDDYEAMIYVEQNNFYRLTPTVTGYRGDTRGARIRIYDSSLTHSRFCKGAIVYRKAPFVAD